MTLGEMERPLQFFITNKHEIYTPSVFWDCVLEIFRVSYSIVLIPIPMGDVCM